MKAVFKFAAASVMLCFALLAGSCSTGMPSGREPDETVLSSETEEKLVQNNPSAFAIASRIGDEADNEPFSSYTYDFSVYENNYMITAAPDENGTGLTLTVEDNQFGFSKFSVSPPDNYMVCLPYSQQYAADVCTVIKGEGEDSVPDLLKIDFYLMDFEDETLPYTVSRLYSILDGSLAEVRVYETARGGNRDEEVDSYEKTEFEEMEYIPESNLYRTEPLVFMPEPVVTRNEDGSLEAEVITYTLDPSDMTMRRAREDCTPENTLYYGYAAHAVAGEIYKYFIATSLNVSDYDNFAEVSSPDGGDEKYFFKVDDPRFSTVDEFKAYVSLWFDESIVNRMFRNAPQQYRDIEGELYTILGDGGINEKLGKLTITSFERDGDRITYHTKQEKFNSDHILDRYIDGGDFVIDLTDSGFKVIEYRYPTED